MLEVPEDLEDLEIPLKTLVAETERRLQDAKQGRRPDYELFEQRVSEFCGRQLERTRTDVGTILAGWHVPVLGRGGIHVAFGDIVVLRRRLTHSSRQVTGPGNPSTSLARVDRLPGGG